MPTLSRPDGSVIKIPTRLVFRATLKSGKFEKVDPPLEGEEASKDIKKVFIPDNVTTHVITTSYNIALLCQKLYMSVPPQESPSYNLELDLVEEQSGMVRQKMYNGQLLRFMQVNASQVMDPAALVMAVAQQTQGLVNYSTLSVAFLAFGFKLSDDPESKDVKIAVMGRGIINDQRPLAGKDLSSFYDEALDHMTRFRDGVASDLGLRLEKPTILVPGK